MKITTHLLLFPILALAACQGDYSSDSGGQGSKADNQGQSGSTFRLELESVGPGSMVIVEPKEAVCDPDAPICSFSFLAGTRIVLEGDFAYTAGAGWQEDCDGLGQCSFLLEQDSLVVANFEPTIPDVIIDPVRGEPLEKVNSWTEGAAQVPSE